MTARTLLVCVALCSALSWRASSAESNETSSDERTGSAAGVVTETAKKVVDMAKEAPPLAPGEQLDQYARTASRFIRPLSLPTTIVATLVGFALLLFGRKLFRIGIVLYMMAIMGLIGRAVGGLFQGGGALHVGQLVGGLIGCVAGAGLALPLRAAVRFLIGAFAGGILVFVAVQAFTSSVLVTILATAAGIIVSGFLTFIYPTPLLIVGFSMFGAALASVGILSVATEPARFVIPESGEMAERLIYRPAHVAGVVLAAVLGGIFQSQFEVGDETEE